MPGTDAGGDSNGADADVLPDAPPGMATVIVTRLANGMFGYAPNVPILVFRTDGTLASQQVTDANGSVTMPVEEGWTIARVAISDPSSQVDAIVASPGKTYRFGGAPPATPITTIGQLQVSWPARTGTGSPVHYAVITPCHESETTSTFMTIDLRSDCATGPFDIIVSSRRSYQETRVAVQRNVQPAANVNVSFAQATWTSSTSAPVVHVSGAPEASAQCTTLQWLGDLAIWGDSETTYMNNCNPSVLDVPEASKVIYGASWGRDDSSTLEMYRASTYGTAPTMDASQRLPWISNVAYAPATRTATWTTEASATVDATIVKASKPGVYWEVYAPNGLASSYRLPSLPTAFAAADFPPNASVYIHVTNFDIEGKSADEVMARDGYTDTYYDWNDQPRRVATARTQ